MTPSTPHPAPRAAVLAVAAVWLVSAMIVSIYLAWHHANALYGPGASLNCPQTDTVNCDIVNASEYSELFGVPLSIYGLAVYLTLFGAVAAATRRPGVLGPAFGIALLAVVASVLLLVISKFQIGFICLWCVSLYVLNGLTAAALPWASRRPARALLLDALASSVRWPREARWLAAGLTLALAVTAAGERGYRGAIAARDANDDVKGQPATTPPATAQHHEGFRLPGPLFSLALKRGAAPIPSELQSRIGRGRAIALFFWAPGFALSESELMKTAAFAQRSAPNIDLFAVAGRRTDRKVEAIQEAFLTLGLSDAVPLLIDEDYAISKALDVTDVPNLVVVDHSGNLIVKGLKGLAHAPGRGDGAPTGAEMLRALAAGEGVNPVAKAAPYYPGTELYGRCAPSFKLPDFSTGKEVKFTGRSPRGKPTLLMFWSSTCKHCLKEIPGLLAHHAKHKDSYDVVSITQIKKDKPDGSFSHREATKRYIEQQEISWPVLEDVDGLVNELFKVVSTPTTFLIAPSGEVVDAWYFVHPDPGAAVDAAIASMPRTSGACKARELAPRPALSLTMTAPDASPVELRSVVDSPTIVHLWATGCVPCLKELPSFLKFKDRIEDDGAEVIMLSVEDEQAADTIREFQAKHALAFPSYRAPRGGLADHVDLAYSVPRTFLLNADGEILDIRYGDQAWDDPAFERRVRSRLQVAP